MVDRTTTAGNKPPFMFVPGIEVLYRQERRRWSGGAMERATAGDRCVFSSVCVCPVLGNFAALHRSALSRVRSQRPHVASTSGIGSSCWRYARCTSPQSNVRGYLHTCSTHHGTHCSRRQEAQHNSNNIYVPHVGITAGVFVRTIHLP